MAHGEIFAVGSHGASAAAEPQPSRAVASGRRECRDEGRGAPGLASAGRWGGPSVCRGALSAPRWGSPRERRGGSSCNGQRCRAAGGALSRVPAAVASAPSREQRTKGDGWADGRAPLRGREGAACPAPVFSLWHLGLAAPAARCAAVRPWP
ncbi:translation initiation factor IF-2-like [Tympanuchus pallidicinctus]|uniref:translation initiation factor IF-2-like n=1 Tax=Tympanuchus pallidicinctus TaxID=109042 RepID=UPI002286F531|nr:translation initiation factor IF-2-like [Tympanuchus pallidicinctus]XP_052522395.1 translation initiation factor IF-2-like [Tympanuchus pallidicinctus]XP_052522396.1 translation initiation factor IF-2-like [Tympanuchus pallidicinctus]XP_052522397.1 translation initiation factor IF-2-like [Tympanuchus pallidicinctus]XP_052522398.1 translation initiation factor IF-2-like [Tympanuchus pallidicinctus]